ncbi:hypothetical protein BKA66DRAFT_23141 [Pyrenochaeta sp. MPI-SDFR-AT-0127]|nr:hypothetical protein BKA66DRAFT_23141 [Pyrenochaeta sp. MPI-SDFR-AT-0127]
MYPRMPGSRLQPTVLQSVLDHISAGENNSEISRATGVTRKVIIKLRMHGPLSPKTLPELQLQASSSPSSCQNLMNVLVRSRLFFIFVAYFLLLWSVCVPSGYTRALCYNTVSRTLAAVLFRGTQSSVKRASVKNTGLQAVLL